LFFNSSSMDFILGRDYVMQFLLPFKEEGMEEAVLLVNVLLKNVRCFLRGNSLKKS